MMSLKEKKEKDRARFEARCVKRPGGCLDWRGAKDSAGAGVCRMYGVMVPARRVAWDLAHKQKLRAHQTLYRTCKNRSCVAPEHHSLSQEDAARRKTAPIEAGVSLKQGVEIIREAFNTFTAKELGLPGPRFYQIKREMPRSPSLALFLHAIRAHGLEVVLRPRKEA